MPATVRLGASLKALINGSSEYPVDHGLSVREALIQLGIRPELIALVTVNGELQTKDYVIQDGDAVRVMAVIGGG